MEHFHGGKTKLNAFKELKLLQFVPLHDYVVIIMLNFKPVVAWSSLMNSIDVDLPNLDAYRVVIDKDALNQSLNIMGDNGE